METKKDIRNRIEKERQRMSRDIWKKKTDVITEKVLLHPWFQNAKTIYSYIDMKGEVKTSELISSAWTMGKAVAVPKITENRMEFYYISSFNEVSPGTFDVEEPVTNLKADGKDGLVLMPGVAFDVSLHRIGYGKGFYDRYLFSHPSLQTMALAFEFQLFEEIPSEDFDIAPEWLITEDRIIEGSKLNKQK